ncbi:MAG: hypothetical protein JKY93_11080 [Gammaproteobacteria bacterium]|nr:hypothetical protein [Gammaproteobacteria bacterium]
MRDLSAAHASGLINDDQYRAVRSEILNALEKNKPLPKIDYEDFQLPVTLLDSSHKKPYLLITFLLAIVLIAAGGVFYIQQSTQQQGIHIPITNIEHRAMALLGSSADEPQIFAQFVAEWDDLSVANRQQLTNAVWWPKLQAKLKNKLAGVKSQDVPDQTLVMVIENTLLRLNETD